jgi:hypothetical protein
MSQHLLRGNTSGERVFRGAIHWHVLAGIATLAFVLSITTQTKANTISFAQFTEASPGGNLFAYNDNGVGNDSQFGTSVGGGPLGAAIPVNFTYLTVAGPVPADLTGNQAATVSMTSSSITPVVTGFGGAFGDQQFFGGGTVSNTISITRDTPAAEGNGTRTNLLTVTFTGQLIGPLGGRTPQFNADSSVAGYTVNYTSDFLTFSQSTEQDFSLTFSSWFSNNDGNGLEVNALDDFFASATASGTGTFDANAMVGTPEPAAFWLASLALFALVGIRRKQLFAAIG